jgi:nicotinamidase/pyrazinamidase
MFENEKPESTALLVIDMQVDFLGDNGRLRVDPARLSGLISNVNTAIIKCQERGATVIHIANEFPRFSMANLFRKFAAIQGSPGAALDPRVRQEGTRYLSKRRSDAFTNPEVDRMLSQLGVRTVLLAGVFAGGCVRATARGALQHGYRAVVLSECIASRSDESTRRALDSMRSSGALVVPAA